MPVSYDRLWEIFVKKNLVKNEDRLCKLGFVITLHDKIPDVVLCLEEKNWPYFKKQQRLLG